MPLDHDRYTGIDFGRGDSDNGCLGRGYALLGKALDELIAELVLQCQHAAGFRASLMREHSLQDGETGLIPAFPGFRRSALLNLRGRL